MSARACRCDRPSPPAALQQRAARRARRVSARAGGSAWGPMIGQQAGTDKGLCLPDTISYLGVFPVAFIPFMLCERLTDPARLQDRRYIAEAKLDGQRAQLHIRQGRTIACYSRRGLDLLRHAGMAWLREMTWPVASPAHQQAVEAARSHVSFGVPEHWPHWCDVLAHLPKEGPARIEGVADTARAEIKRPRGTNLTN